MSIILHILCRNIDFSKGGTAPLKGGLDIWKCTLHYFKGHGANFSRNFSYFVWILSLQKHTALPQRKITLIQKGMFVLNTAFVGRYGDVVTMLKSSSILCKNCVLLKGRCSSIYLRQSEHLDTSSSNACSLVDMNTASSVA